jgi:UDP-glucose 4-epimerase
MRVAITGATGNIGTRLVARLLAEPSVSEVVGIASRLPSAPARSRVRYVRVDLGADDAAARLGASLTGVDVVVHLA